MSTLSTSAQNALIICLGSQNAATQLQAAIVARSTSLPQWLQVIVIQNLCSDIQAGQEVIAAIGTGANLSRHAMRRIVQSMAGDGNVAGAGAAGNEMINFIQSVPNAKPFLL